MEGDQNESDVEQNESDNYYSCEMPRKKLNTSRDTMGIFPVHLHGVGQHSWASTAKNKFDRAVEVLKASLSDAYVVSTDQLASSKSVNIFSETEQKASELDHLHNLMKEKLTTATYFVKIQILTLAPDSWSHQYCAEHYVPEDLVKTTKELKKIKGILAKPAQKQGKVISQNTIDLVLTMYGDDEFSCQMPGKKEYVSTAKGVYKQKRFVLCNLREMYAVFNENILMVSLDLPNFVHFSQNGVYLLGLQVLIL